MTPIRVVHASVISPFETPTSRVGFPSTTGPSRAAGVMTENNVDLATNIKCTASSGRGSQQAELPTTEGRDVLELIFDTAKDYRRARIVSSLDICETQRIIYELEKNVHNIDILQAYFDGWYEKYGKFQHFIMGSLYMIKYNILINSLIWILDKVSSKFELWTYKLQVYGQKY